MDIIRAWKDPEYRQSLEGAQRAQLPDHPAGLLELTEVELDSAAGGAPKTLNLSCIPTYTIYCYTESCSNNCPSSTHSFCGLCW
jgi:mersacidin/lichenicidin family type 2 lantibiotic